MTLTKVRLEWLTKISSRDEIDDIDGDEIRELARIALAALESRADAEPVAYMIGGHYLMHAKDPKVDNYTSAVPLYTRPQPAPVVPQIIHSQGGTTVYADYYAIGWNACRAAMLQGKAEQPHSTQQTGWTGNGDADAALVMLDRIDTLDSADDARIEDIKRIIRTLAKPVSQPYTLPEGYALVPVEPTIAMLDEFDSIIDYGADDSNDAWRRLLAAAWIKSLPAAPQQEAE